MYACFEMSVFIMPREIQDRIIRILQKRKEVADSEMIMYTFSGKTDTYLILSVIEYGLERI